jgi:uncharacterized membrane protein
VKRFKTLDFWLGLLILTALGFLLFTLVSGIGYLIALVFLDHSWWYITLGTLLGMISVFLILLGLHDREKKEWKE